MAKKNILQQVIDSGTQFGEMSRKQAEDMVRTFVKAGAVRRSDTEATVQTLIDRGRETTERIADAIQHEVARQLGWLASRVDDLEDQIENFVARLTPGSEATPAGTQASRASSAAKAPAATSAAKRTPAKRTPAKRTPAKKTAAKKTAAKKTAAKKTAAKKAGGRKTAAKRSTTTSSPSRSRAATG